ncbi:phytanoyl-CoA dioxygenase family protein [Poriferisphaera sp. WC338]|uniref:phytanoyl-CoA dioxygenase family protein n=1 Tax=Poriferisphaera sp. WC338 TaxID=3425129 RepID=UPI003D813B50
MQDLNTLTSQYERDGVIRVYQLFTPRELAEVKQQITRYIYEVADNLPETDIVRESDGSSIRNLWRMEQHDPFFAKLTKHHRIINLVQRLLHNQPICLGIETFNKPAQIGSAIPPHQDNAYFCQSPPDVLTVWIAMDPATPENGPVTYYKSSHTCGMLPHKTSSVSGNSMGLAEPFEEGEPFIGTLNPGDALIHHCQIVHESQPNHSQQPRCGLLMVFRGAHTQTDPILHQNYKS